jgi:hypothetical protein
MKPYQISFKKKATQKREKKLNKWQRPKSKQTNNPKEACRLKVREPLSIKTSNNCMKHVN